MSLANRSTQGRVLHTEQHGPLKARAQSGTAMAAETPRERVFASVLRQHLPHGQEDTFADEDLG